MAKRKKDGRYDMRTKEGKQAQEVENFIGSPMGGCILRLIVIITILLILSEIFPSFGEWINSLE